MSLSAEAWLMLLATGLYVYDALLLLSHDELVLIQGAKPPWRAAFGAHGWKLGGKEPWLPNLCAPWQLLARVQWKLEDGLAGAAAADVRLPRMGCVPRVGVTLLGLLMFAALPVCLFAVRHTAWTLVTIAMMYACIVVVLLGIRRDWLALGLVPGRFWPMAIECIACPPFCVNAVRRASLLMPARISMSAIASQEEQHGRLGAFKRQLQVRVREQMDALPEGSARLSALKAAAESLREECDS